MIQRLLQGLLLSSFLCLSGCAALSDFEDALEGAGWAQFDRAGRRANQRGRVSLVAHRADGSWTLGAGAVVRGGRVLTVAHVLNGATEIEAEVHGRLISVEARVARRIRAVPEDLIELRLEESPGVLGFDGFTHEDTLEVAAGEPSQLWASSGLFNLPCASAPGDSGSPLLDPEGRLVGLLVGDLGGSPVWSTIPTRERAPRPSDFRLEARSVAPDWSESSVDTEGRHETTRAAESAARRSEGLRRRA